MIHYPSDFPIPTKPFGWDRFRELLHAGVIVDGRAGGFVLGRRLADGGIPVLTEFGRARFRIHGVIDNGVYLLNQNASREHAFEISALNGAATLDTPLPTGNSDGAIRHLIITQAQPNDRVIWITSRQRMVNPTATEKYFWYLEGINWENNPLGKCAYRQIFRPRNAPEPEDASQRPPVRRLRDNRVPNRRRFLFGEDFKGGAS